MYINHQNSSLTNLSPGFWVLFLSTYKNYFSFLVTWAWARCSDCFGFFFFLILFCSDAFPLKVNLPDVNTNVYNLFWLVGLWHNFLLFYFHSMSWYIWSQSCVCVFTCMFTCEQISSILYMCFACLFTSKMSWIFH